MTKRVNGNKTLLNSTDGPIAVSLAKSGDVGRFDIRIASRFRVGNSIVIDFMRSHSRKILSHA